MRNDRQHFVVRFRLDDHDRFLIWYSGERDGVMVLNDGHVAAFASEHGIDVAMDTSAIWNTDAISRWTQAPDAGRIDCNDFHNAWNLLGDIAESIGTPLEFSDDALHVHEKLFWGCHIAAIMPRGECFVPEWPAGQVETLANALRDALAQARPAFGRG